MKRTVREHCKVEFMNWEKLGLNQYPLDHKAATHRLSLAWQQLNVYLSLSFKRY